jgi:hypothetical protein
MDPNVLTFAAVMAVVVTSVVTFIGIGLGTRALWLRGPRAKPVAASRIEDRLERLETAVDAIAIEVERISESQRFSVSLLSDRLPPRAGERGDELPSSGTVKLVNTPH